MTKKTDPPLRDKLFRLADMVLDEALDIHASVEMRMDCLKQVAALYIGHMRASKRELTEDDENTTMDSLRKRIEEGAGK